jgi:hypothetical protein
VKYLWDFWLYQGKNSGRSGRPSDIVIDFAKYVTKTTTPKPHIMVADSYYGSLDLANLLHEMKWGFLISCKKDRPNETFSMINSSKESIYLSTTRTLVP